MNEKGIYPNILKKTDFSIVVIGCYFGTLREDYKVFVKSISNNPSIDFLIFSDCEWGVLPRNLKVVNCSFNDIRARIEDHFDFQTCLNEPYKLCDYKPVFGEVFMSYIKEYDFWGYCDFDMIFGDLRTFITDDKLCNYDKIYLQGHLSLYRNVERLNTLYKREGGKLDYKYVFSTDDNCVFDEVDGIYYKCVENNVRIYTEIEYIDIYPYMKKMWQTRDLYHLNESVPRNFSKQAFGYCDGHIYKWYIENGDIKKKEYAYIHFSHKKYAVDEVAEKFYITANEMVPYQSEQEIKYEKFIKGIDDIKMLFAEFIFRLKRKSKKMIRRFEKKI